MLEWKILILDLEDNDMIQQYLSTYDDNSVQHQSSIGTLEGYAYSNIIFLWFHYF